MILTSPCVRSSSPSTDTFEQFRQMRAERIQKLVTLQEKERELCEFLGESPYQIHVACPSDAQLGDIQMNLHNLQRVKVERCSTYQNLKLQIESLMNTLEVTPSTNFERDALMNENGSFHLTTVNLRKLEDVLRKYEQMMRDKEEQIALLKSKLDTLYSRISEDENHRKNFMARCTGIGQSTTGMILREIERCEEIKRANIKPCIEKIRCDIANLWEMLTFSEDERSKFNAYYTDSFNEDVLELHEMECTRLEMLYEECKEILDLADQRRVLWERMNHLKEQATNPSRLKNRGGRLLKEEKERKSLEKSLPRLESQLKKELVTYYEKHGNPFLWYGKDLLQTIEVESVIEKTLLNLNARSNASKASTPRSTPRATPSRGNSRHGSVSNLLAPLNLDDASVASYSQFQEQIELASYLPTPSKRYTPQISNAKRFLTPATRSATRSASRLPLRQIQPSPYHHRAHSSPTTPKRTTAFKLKPSPRRITPRRYGFSTTKNSLQF
uniref:Protein regulator of cytokinesis 1 n=1 Tax=Lygus hesperus TaxID=30085 RepID=A0A0A9XWR7_LYGHE